MITASHQPTVATILVGTKEEAVVAVKAEIHASFVMLICLTYIKKIYNMHVYICSPFA